ncbi:MAG: protein kinase, partial [Dokdonella sp.]
IAESLAQRSTSHDSPRMLGPYTVLRSIGVGGMGEVWLAERSDGEFEQRVAIKQVAYPTPGLLQRFRQERQILAHLDHPNIARLLDGGVDAQGAPYLVMEYVEGVPLTEYVREHALGLPARLRLFLRVCEAVQYAHQNLVVHRDLKPSNILITADGAPKLLDFGIAKVLATTGGNAPTQTHARLLSPDYAAPEQFSGAPITTATDVYALGVVLYELLAGARPARAMPSHPNGSATLPTADPPPPSAALDRTTGSTLRRALRGDLDRITLTALAAEPRRRYASAEALAADIHRYLNGRPIAARGDSPMYRLRKFASRNRVVLAAAAFVFATLSVATVVSLHQAARANAQAQRAEAVRKFLADTFAQSSPDQTQGNPITANELLGKSEQRLANARMPIDVRADLTTLIGTFYWQLADNVAAERALTRAVALADSGGVPDALAARSLLALAQNEQDKSRYDTAYRHATRALTLAIRAGDEGEPETERARRLIAGLTLYRDGPAGAEPLLRRLLEADRVQYGEASQQVADDLIRLGYALGWLSRYDEAESALQASIAKARALHGNYYSSIALALNHLGTVRMLRGDYAGSENAMRECLAILVRLWGEGNVRSSIERAALLNVAVSEGRMEEVLPALLKNRDEASKQRAARGDHFAESFGALGSAYLGLGRLEEAEAAYQKMQSIIDEPQSAEKGQALDATRAQVAAGLGSILELQGRYADAETAYRRALVLKEKTLSFGPHAVAQSRAALGNLLRLQHHFTEALHEISEAEQALGTRPGSQDPVVALVKAQLAEAQLDAGSAQDGRATAASALAVARSVLPAGNWQLGTSLFALARCELALGNAAAAEPLLRDALAVRNPPHPADDLRVLEVKVALANAIAALGRNDEAGALIANIEPALRDSPAPYAADLRARLPNR